MDDRAATLQALKTLIDVAQRRFGITATELQQLLISDAVPATIFREDATPLEAVVSYLSTTGKGAKEIGKLVGRSTNYIEQILQRGTLHQQPTPTQYVIPVGLLTTGSAGAVIAHHLSSLGLTNAEIARLMRKDDSTVWTWLNRGAQK